MLDQAQIDYIGTVTNARGAAFTTPYVFVGASAQANHFQIYATTGNPSYYYASVPVHLPLPDPPSPVLDSAIDQALTEIERHISQGA